MLIERKSNNRAKQPKFDIFNLLASFLRQKPPLTQTVHRSSRICDVRILYTCDTFLTFLLFHKNNRTAQAKPEIISCHPEYLSAIQINQKILAINHQ